MQLDREQTARDTGREQSEVNELAKLVKIWHYARNRESDGTTGHETLLGEGLTGRGSKSVSLSRAKSKSRLSRLLRTLGGRRRGSEREPVDRGEHRRMTPVTSQPTPPSPRSSSCKKAKADRLVAPTGSQFTTKNSRVDESCFAWPARRGMPANCLPAPSVDILVFCVFLRQGQVPLVSVFCAPTARPPCPRDVMRASVSRIPLTSPAHRPDSKKKTWKVDPRPLASSVDSLDLCKWRNKFNVGDTLLLAARFALIRLR